MALNGLHKQTANRVLEPFLYVHGVITATEWDNFFGLRLHKAAQPEMRALAVPMWESLKASTPKLLEPGEWHTPFADDELTIGELQTLEGQSCGDIQFEQAKIITSVARCARVSHESLVTPGKRSTYEEDQATYGKLNIPGTPTYNPDDPIHASPAEHQGTPDEYLFPRDQMLQGKKFKHQEQHGNFVGWRQYRKMLPGEACAPLPKEYQ